MHEEELSNCEQSDWLPEDELVYLVLCAFDVRYHVNLLVLPNRGSVHFGIKLFIKLYVRRFNSRTRADMSGISYRQLKQTGFHTFGQ